MKHVSTMNARHSVTAHVATARLIMRTLLLTAIACLALPLSAQASTAFENTWNATLDIAEGGSKTEDGQMVKAKDGGYIGVFTTGASDKQYEGRVVKFAANGTTLWEQSLQVEQCTTGQKVCEGNDGNIYVLGTTKVNSVLRAYIASFDQSGTPLGTKVFDATFSKCYIDAVRPYKDAVVAFYTGVTTINTQAYYSDVMGTGLSIVSEKERRVSDNIHVLNNVLLSGDWVLASTQYDYTFFNLATGAIKNAKTGTFEGGCEDNGNLYLLQRMDNSYMIYKFSIVDGNPATAWMTDVDFSTAYYFGRLFPGDDGNIYFVKKGSSFTDFAKLSSDGEIIWKKTDVWIDSEVNDGFVYSLGIDADQNIILAGHTGRYKVFITKLDQSCNVLSCNKSVVFDDYKYAYTFENQSSFADGKLAVCGYVRPSDLNAGYSQFFALIDPSAEDMIEWKTLYAAGPIPTVYPVGGAFDKEGNSYVAAISDNKPRLAKYDTNGNMLWISPVTYENATSGYVLSVVPLDNGNVVVAGYTANDNDYSEYYKNLVACFDAEGKAVWSKQLSDKTLYMYPNEIGLVKASDGNLLMISSAMKTGDYTSGTLIDKIDADGNVIWSKIVVLDKNFIPVTAKLTPQGDIAVVGYAYGSDYTYHATIAKISQEGELIFSCEHESTEGYRYIDSWTDKQGKTYAVGYSDNNGIYAVYDAEGKEMVFELSDDKGYWVSVAGNDSNAVLIGSFSNATSGTAVGKAMAISTENHNTTAWTQNISNSEASSYAYYGVADNDNIIVTGYVENESSKQVAEYAIVLAADGSEKQTLVSDIMDNSSGNFVPMAIFGDANNFVTLSRFALDNYIYMGNVRGFHNTASTGVKTLNATSTDVKAVEFFDISGRKLASRPASGLYITRTVFTDGTAKMAKHTATR